MTQEDVVFNSSKIHNLKQFTTVLIRNFMDDVFEMTFL